jgi:hypothetical protein
MKLEYTLLECRNRIALQHVLLTEHEAGFKRRLQERSALARQINRDESFQSAVRSELAALKRMESKLAKKERTE